jgi:predicted DNA-binding transcriptional regulator YafY
MYSDLRRFEGRTVEMIYLDRNNAITQRTIRITSVDSGYVTAYCYMQRGPRLFKSDCVLAVMPAEQTAG